MQQTCREIDELIRTNRKISVNLHGYFVIEWEASDWRHHLYRNREIDGIYGPRLEMFLTCQLKSDHVESVEAFQQLSVGHNDQV